jgi:uncharacterized protein YukE
VTTYVVDMTNVAFVADEMGRIANNLNGILEDLDCATKQHLTEWTSHARDQYNAAKKVWDRKAADMVVQAANAQASLGAITDNYALAEYQGLGLWSR